MKTLGIFGTSGMAREVADIAYECGYEPLFVARDENERTASKILNDVILEPEVFRYQDVQFVIGIGEGRIRRRIAEKFRGVLKFTNLIHPTASFGYEQRQSFEFSVGNIFCAGARLTNNIKIGNFNIINQNVAIAHDVDIGDFVHFAPGCVISGNVNIGNYCWVGAGAVINQGSSESKLKIADNVLIGSGAVVVKDCTENGVYAGVPAKRIK